MWRRPEPVEGWYVDGVLKSSGSTAFSFTYDPGIMGNGSTNRTFQLMLKVRDNENSTKTKTVTVTILADKRNYFVTDHLGNVRATVDQSGAVIGYDDFYPYGQVMPGRSSNTANANDIYKFTGHERDAELGLDYMLARNYDPEIGRFLSVDPLYDKYPGLSPYMYVEGNPLRLIDPDGRYPFLPQIVGSLIGAATEYASQVINSKIDGKSWSQALVPSDMGDISAAAGMGAVTMGVSAIPKVAGMGIFGKATVDGALNVVEGVAKNSGGEVQSENTITSAATDFTAGFAFSGANSAITSKVVKNPQFATDRGAGLLLRGTAPGASETQKAAAANYGNGKVADTVRETAKVGYGVLLKYMNKE